MKDVFKQMFRRISKKGLIAVAVTVSVLGVAAAAKAWYPDRPTYTMEHPADHVTFDSITNNPDEGDERAFFEVKDNANTQPNGFSHTITSLQDGQTLLLRVFVHNDAASNLNGTNYDGPGVAKNTKVRIFLPTAMEAAMKANAYISADNAQPKEVADTINLGSNGSFNVSYVAGSAVQYTNAVPSGIKLSDNIVTSGAPIGYTKADGIVPGCAQYSSIVTIRVKVHKPSYSISKQVRLDGSGPGNWKESIDAQPGQTVEWSIGFKNQGGTLLNDVIVLDQVPAGLSVVPGSVQLDNSNNPNGYTYPASAVQANGRQVNVDIGSYNPGSNAYLYFKTTVPQAKDLECGTNQFENVAYATPKNFGSVNDTASVDVNGNECVKPKTPSYSCDLLTVAKLGGRKIRATVDTTAINGATVKNYTYDFGDGSTPLVTDKSSVEYTYAKDGSFVAGVKVAFDVNGETKTADGSQCMKPVSFTTPKTTPTELPNTGAGDVLGIFTAVTLAGALWHRLFWSRRFAK